MELIKLCSLIYLLFITTSCTLSYNIESLNSSTKNNDSSISDPTSTNIPIVISKDSSLEILTGEEINFSFSGGNGSLSVSDSGTGFLNLLNFKYTTPFEISPRIDTLKVVDSLGQELTANIKISSFQEKDSYRFYNSNSRKGLQNKIKADSNGNLYSVGATYSQTDSSKAIWIVRKSTDNGNNWTTIDSFQSEQGYKSTASDMAFDSLGNIYVVGSADDSSGSGWNKWVTRKSSDAGATWTTIDDFRIFAGQFSAASSIVIDSFDNIYVGGSAVTFPYQWHIRKSSNHGNTWNNIFSYRLDSSANAILTSLTIDASNNIYAIGYAGDSWLSPNSKDHWIVQKSSDLGASWNIVDNFKYIDTNTYYSRPNTGDVDSLGNVYVTGFARNAAGGNDWIIRKSTNAGASWNTILNENYYGGNSSSQGFDIKIMQPSKLITIGYATDSSGNATCLTKMSADAGSTWSNVNIENTSYPNNRLSCNSIYLKSLNEIFVAGTNNEGSLSIIKSNDSGSTWSSINSENFYIGRPSQYNRILEVSPNKLIAVGYSEDNTTYIMPYWTTRISNDGGNSWSLVHNYQMNTNAPAFATDIAKDSSGNIYIVGYARDTYFAGGSNFWIVKKSTDGGNSWTDIDTFQLVAGKDCSPSRININQSDEIFIYGTCLNSSSVATAIIRKSINSGTSFSTISTTTSITAISFTSTNSIIYSADKIYSSGWKWIIRKSLDSGASWSTVDNFSYVAGYDSIPSDIKVDSNGIIYVAGTAKDSSYASHWLLRKSSDNGLTWQTIDNYQFNSSGNSSATALYIDSNNNLFVGGSIFNPIEKLKTSFLLRKSKDNGLSWKNIDMRKQNNFTSFSSIYSIDKCMTDKICLGLSDATSSAEAPSAKVRILKTP